MRFAESIIFSVVLVAIAFVAKADIVTLRNMGNTIMPMNESRISMESETVEIVPSLGGYDAHCIFEMKSHSDSVITTTVGFPINRPPWYPEFEVKVGGERIKPSLRRHDYAKGTDFEQSLYYEPDYTHLVFAGYYTWEMKWDPRETVEIEIRYSAGMPEDIDGIVRGVKFLYIVRTGKLWRGPIGKARISIDSPHLRDWDKPEKSKRFTYPDAMKKESDTRLVWNFTNWEPDKDIIYEIYYWASLEGLYASYLLPRDYLGEKRQYNSGYIDDLTKKEFEKAWNYYPERADTTSRAPYGCVIADILRHEILARNGYLFTRETSDAAWDTYFLRYSKMGWYRTGTPKELSEADRTYREKFNDYERRNYEFLGAYVRSRACLLTTR